MAEPILVRTLVLDVRNRVFVVVRIRAAVVVLVAVGILGIIRALVGGIQDAVEVVVHVGAAVLVQVVVLVLGLEHAGVDGIRQAVPVGVRVIRAAVVVLVAVEILGLVRAGVLGIQVAVAVAVPRCRLGLGSLHEAALCAILGRRQEHGRVSVRLGDPDVLLRLGHEALLQLDLRELEMALGQGQFPRRAANRAVALSLFGELPQAFDLATQFGRLRAAGESDDHDGNDERERSERARHQRPPPRWASRDKRMALSAYSSAVSASVAASP